MDTHLPQLRVRTEFSFRQAYGPIKQVAERLKALGTPAAGIVDIGGGTWGHARFEKGMLAAGIEPMFGAELRIARGEDRPRCWVLAEDIAALYRLTTEAHRREGLCLTDADLAGAKGVLRFAGAALHDPETFDYIDLMPSSPLRVRNALALARHTGKPIVVTSNNAYPAPGDRDRFLALSDSQMITPQHLLPVEELRRALPQLSADDWTVALRNTAEVAERLRGVRLRKAPIIHLDGDLPALALKGKEERLAKGHIAVWTDEYEARLRHELEMIRLKDYDSYFLVVADLVRYAKQHMLVGPARGSSAGSLVCYLTGITEVDPLVHHLLFERFIDVTRKDLPDIDIDFSDTKRDMVFAYLAEKYGRDNVARIGNISTLKPASVLAQVGKRMGIPAKETYGVRNAIVEYSSGDSRYGKGLQDTLDTTSPGRDFAKKYPEAMVMCDLEGHAWHTSVHAAGVMVCNEPISNFCTVDANGVGHIDKPDSEYMNLLKIDALGLRTLGIIEDSGAVTADTLYGLKLDDPEVFAILNQRKFAGVFQFEGRAQRSVSQAIHIKSFRELDHITALARPGPLGGGASEHYIQRAAGNEPVEFRHPSMADYLGDTLGVVLYQEQVMRICRDIGKFSWESIAIIRKAMSGSKGKEFFDQKGREFVAGAQTVGLPAAEAQVIWDELCNFGAWGMNKSHTVSYAIIGYWCAWMKRYHPLEFAAACLRSAKDDDQTMEILRELAAEGVEYTPFDIDHSEIGWSVKDGRLVGGFTNLVGVGPAKATAFIEHRNNGGLSAKDRAAIAKCTVRFADLTPAHTLWRDLYDNWESHGILTPVRNIADIADRDEAVFIGKCVQRIRRNENEAIRVKNRGGKRMKGDTDFCDIMVVDDSISAPVAVRIQPRNWDAYGRAIADHARDDEDWFLFRGWKIPGYSMLIARKIKCLTRPDFFAVHNAIQQQEEKQIEAA